MNWGQLRLVAAVRKKYVTQSDRIPTRLALDPTALKSSLPSQNLPLFRWFVPFLEGMDSMTCRHLKPLYDTKCDRRPAVPDLNGYSCVTAHEVACERRAKLRKLARISHVKQSAPNGRVRKWLSREADPSTVTDADLIEILAVHENLSRGHPVSVNRLAAGVPG
jgi:hypothetical protein